MTTNQKIHDFLITRSKEVKDDNYRKKAYVNAAKTVLSLPYQLTIEVLNNEKIPSIGKSIKDHIINFLSLEKGIGISINNKSFDKDKVTYENIEKTRVIVLFKKIYHLSEEKAEQWYQKGYRSLGDIKREDCSETEWIYLCNYQQLNERIRREEIDLFDLLLREHLYKINPTDTVQYLIAGSYRRKKPTCGDIDILAIKKSGRDVMSEILSFPYIIYTLSRGQTSFNGIGGVWGICHRVDVLLTTPEEYICALFHYTGSAEHNIYIRKILLSKGLTLNEKELKKISTQEVLPVKSEEEIFRYADLPYKSPENREMTSEKNLPESTKLEEDRKLSENQNLSED